MDSLTIGRKIRFRADADTQDNVYDNISFHKAVFYEDFFGKAIDATNDFTFTTVAGGTATITAPHCATITSPAADDDDSELAMGLDVDISQNPVLEVRARNDDVSGMAHFIGFSDAQAEGVDTLAFTYAAAALVSTCTDGAGFLMDVDQGAANYSILGVSVNTGTDGTEIDSGTDDADSTWHVYRIAIDSSGNATYWLDGDSIGYEALAVADVPLCVYIGVINREAAANTMDVDYIKLWVDR